MKQRNLIIIVLLSALVLLIGVAAGPNTAVFKALIVQNDATVGGNLTLGGDMAQGAGYPVENPDAGLIFEIGATGAFTRTVITPSAITTVEAYGCTVNSPSAAAQQCYGVRSGRTITFTIVNSAVTPVAITTPHAAGASFWVGGQ